MLFPVFNKLYFILWPFGSIFLIANRNSVCSTTHTICQLYIGITHAFIPTCSRQLGENSHPHSASWRAPGYDRVCITVNPEQPYSATNKATKLFWIKLHTPARNLLLIQGFTTQYPQAFHSQHSRSSQWMWEPAPRDVKQLLQVIGVTLG